MAAVRNALAVLVLVLVATPVLAHVPEFPTDNTSPEQAVHVPDAAKSWSFYDRLGTGGARYYRVELEAGERLRFGTFTPVGDAFTPSVVLMSESLTERGRVPPGVTVPEGMGTVVVEGDRPDAASYEPFAPSASYHTVTVDRTVEASGVYLVAVYEPADRSGPVGVTVGYEESFSPVEYVTVPFDLVRIHQWEGQHPLLVAGPWLLVLVGGAALVRSRRREDWQLTPVRYALVGAALLILGTGASTLLQTGIALAATGPTPGVLVTVVFVVVPLAAGGWVLRFALGDAFALDSGARVGLAVAGAASLATWAGFLVGPAVLLLAAVAPTGTSGDR